MSGQEPRTGDLVALGYISGLHGVRGWVKVHSFTEPREAILDYQPWLVGEERVPVRVTDGGRHGKTVIAALEGVTDRDQARELLDSEIAVHRGQLPELPDDRYYWADLQGLTVVNADGSELGRVAGMLETGANDVMVVQGAAEHLIPFVVGTYVRRVDLAARRIEVDWDTDF